MFFGDKCIVNLADNHLEQQVFDSVGRNISLLK